MKTELYSLTYDDLDIFNGDLSEVVFKNIDKPGFYTIGAIENSDEEENPVGLVQFFVDIRSNGECFGKLVDVYVPVEYRRNGVGTKLVDKVTDILKKSDIKSCIAFLPDEPGKEFSIPLGELSKFLTETDFFLTKEPAVGDSKASESGKYFVRMTRG